jgi:hypothetical protein
LREGAGISITTKTMASGACLPPFPRVLACPGVPAFPSGFGFWDACPHHRKSSTYVVSHAADAHDKHEKREAVPPALRSELQLPTPSRFRLPSAAASGVIMEHLRSDCRLAVFNQMSIRHLVRPPFRHTGPLFVPDRPGGACLPWIPRVLRCAGVPACPSGFGFSWW